MKKSSSSQSLNYHITLSAQFLQTKDLVIKFYDDCLTSHPSKEGCGITSPFSSLFYPHSNKHQHFVSHSAVFQRETCALSQISALFQISALQLGTKSKLAPWALNQIIAVGL